MSDAQVVAVLQNFRHAMSRQGRLVVIDPVIPPGDQSGGHPAQSNKFLDLVEFLLTEGGRGRTRERNSRRSSHQQGSLSRRLLLRH